MQFDVPVLFIIFNQPHITSQTFQAIRDIKPSKLYISADGPRSPDEESECFETRNVVIKNIDWECEVYTKFMENNIGVKRAVSEALYWLFETEEHGIILEYDTVAERDFFNFCRAMLLIHNGNERIMSISGTNYHFGKKFGDGSYYYSEIPNAWGWATWATSWKKWDGDMNDYDEVLIKNMMDTRYGSKTITNFWLKSFAEVRKGENQTWGFPWCYSNFINGGLTVVPNANLIKNIGFGPNATHAKNTTPHANMETFVLKNLDPPSNNEPIREADKSYCLVLAQVTWKTKLERWIVNLSKLFLTKSQRNYIKTMIFKLKKLT